jgi:hypothetical protein
MTLDGRTKVGRPTVMAAVMAFVSIVVAAVTAPLLVYSVTLATFGAAHVLAELRYVDRRFGRRLGIPYAATIAPLLAGAVAARAAGVFGFLDPQAAIMLELSFVTALALSAAKGGWRQQMLAVGIALALGVATLLSPFDAAISLSILHNLTPLAFLWEISQPRSRLRVMSLASIAFIGLPLLVATGLPRIALAAAGIAVPSADPLGAGPLVNHLYVYVPISLEGAGSAIDLFSASVVAQCAHYAAVIFVLPALLAIHDPASNGIVAWPRGGIFAAILIVLSSIVLSRFAAGFVSARALYGIAASLHAWVEIPLVIIAITRKSQANSTTPTSVEAKLAMPETISARAGDSPLTQPMMAASTRITSASAQPTVDQ